MPETPAADVPANVSPSDALLATKSYIPSARPAQGVVPRPHLLDRLNHGLTGRLILLSAPAGFGKMTFLSEWIAAWQTIAPRLGETDQELVRLRKDRVGGL